MLNKTNDLVSDLFYVEVGEHYDSTMFEWDSDEAAKSPDGICWSRRHSGTDSFPEVEARAIILAKTFKHVRIARVQTEVVGYVEG